MKRSEQRVILPAAKAESGSRRREQLEAGPEDQNAEHTLYSSRDSAEPGPRYFGPVGQSSGWARWWRHLTEGWRRH